MPHVTRWSHEVFSRIGAALHGVAESTETQLLMAESTASGGCAYVYSVYGDLCWSAIPDITPQTRAIDFLIGEPDLLEPEMGAGNASGTQPLIFNDPALTVSLSPCGQLARRHCA